MENHNSQTQQSASMTIDNASQNIGDLTPEQRALLILMLRKKVSDRGGQKPNEPLLKHAARDQALPLSFAQQRLWFLYQLEPDTSAYNMTSAVRLSGLLDVVALERTINEVIRRHETLRTTFAEVDGRPVQLIAPQVVFTLAVVSLQEMPPHIYEARAQQLANEEAGTPFDLSQGPLFRITLLRLAEQDHVALFTMHHIISDGWSMGVLVSEVAKLYEAFLNGEDSGLSEPSIQYADYAVWQREWLEEEVLQRQKAYWKQQLAGSPPVLNLPTDRPRPPVQTFQGATEGFALSSALSESLKALSQQTKATAFMILLAAFNTLLYRYSGQEDILVGTPIAGRNRVELEGLIGLFVNTLVLRTDLSGEPTFLMLVDRIRETALKAYANQDLPLEQIVEEFQPDRSMDHTPLFQVMFALQNGPTSVLQMPGLTLSPLDFTSRTAKFDLTLNISETAQAITGSLEFNTDLFDASTIRRMLKHFEVLLDGISADPTQRLWQLPLLSEVEQQQILMDWNTIAADYAGDRRIHELVEEQAKQNPESLAVAFNGQTLTYKQLNERANQLGHYLKMLGIGPEVRVGICVERSLDLVVGLLGILKAGGAYVPLDPAYPKERLAFMLGDAEVKVLLSEQRFEDIAPQVGVKVVLLDKQREVIAQHSSENICNPVAAENLAYVIYTSGSTGRPKGVQITHAGLMNLVSWHLDTYAVNTEDRATQLASIGFDASVWELWPYLAAGASVYIPDDDTRAIPSRLRDWLVAQSITISFLPTPLAEAILSLEWPEEMALKKILTGGDQLRQHPPAGIDLKLTNHYGPTESTVVATWAEIPPMQDARMAPSIGRPIANTQVYILDEHLRPVPVGVTGELHIGGSGLARGYLNRAEHTAEKFIPSPLSVRPGARLYKTGDLARYLLDGNIEFLGRIDRQVKLRGFRIELSEIEMAIRQQQSIQEAIVVACEDEPGDKRLVAYLVLSDDAISIEELRASLKEQLPDYMVPSAFVVIDSIPLTSNGKVDRGALPLPDSSLLESGSAFVAPRTPAEELLAHIWAQVLGLKAVDIDSNFFDIGGHSLLATQLLSRVRQVFQIELSLRSLFEAPTVAGLAKKIETAMRAGQKLEAPPIGRASRDEELPLSFAQQRMWFLDQLEPGTATYNISTAIQIGGQLDISALERAFNEIIRRHEILRTTFVTIDGEPVQVIASQANLPLPLVDLEDIPGSRVEAQSLAYQEAQRPFDLATGPLVRATIVRLDEGDHLVLFTMHHIISDGWSMRVLVDEVATLYESFSGYGCSALTELPIQYADYALWQRRWLQGEVIEAELSYWKGQLHNLPPALDLPMDRPRPAARSFQGAREPLAVSRAVTDSLKAISRQEGVTLFMAVLAAFKALLNRYTNQTDIVVGTPIAGRSHLEAEQLIGLFVNTLVLKTDLSGRPSYRELLRQVRSTVLDAHAHQEVPFEKLVDALQPERDLSRSPLFQVMFVFQNAEREGIEVPGLSMNAFDVDSGTTKFDMTFAVQEAGQRLFGSLQYSTDLFDASTIKRMLGHFEILLEGMVSNPDRQIVDLPLLAEAERHQLVLEWNATQGYYVSDACAHELFEQQVVRTPNAIALVFEQESLTYHDLNRQANQLARHLRGLGIGPEAVVGLYVERSLEMVIGLLGILKAGGAYLPLDPAYPPARIQFMLEDSKASVVLTQERLLKSLPPGDAQVICLDLEWGVIAQQEEDDLASGAIADNLAYVIYTSGSTGLPKGVMLRHKGLCNLAEAQRVAFDLQSSSRVLQFSAFSFDASVSEVFVTLLAGATLCVVPQGSLLPGPAFIEMMREHGITHGTFPPLLLASLPDEEIPALETIVAAGEACTPEIVHRWAKNHRFINAYGPTEGTVCATLDECFDDGRKPSIGRPIANIQVYVLDEQMQPVPVGVPGELHIGGIGLARGYINRPELTAEKFIADPFSQQSGMRLYKTGDLARYLSDGSIEFLGRIDSQVKVRGYRIELGEIESVLRQHSDVRESVVMVREEEPGNKRLVAYLVSEQKPTVSELRSFLKEKLPEYMIPAVFVMLDELPLLPNGKADRRALPAPDLARPEIDGDFVAPRIPAEKALAEIWAQVLRVEQVGIHDNFFELGGDSILSIQVTSRATQAGLRLTPRQLFANQTIAELASVVGVEQAIKATQDLVIGQVPLTPIQHWFFEQCFPDAHHFNQAVLLEVRQALNPFLLDKIVERLLVHHDGLRLRFIKEESTWKQINTGAEKVVPFSCIDLSNIPDEQQSTAIEASACGVQISLNLAEGPLVRFVMFDLGAHKPSRLLIVAHHLVIDGVSWRILLDDLQSAYFQLSRGLQILLPPKTSSFKLWSQRLLNYSGSPALLQEASFWLDQIRSDINSLPVDYPLGINTVDSARVISVGLDPEMTRALLQEVPEAYQTQINDVLMTALLLAITKWSGGVNLLVELEGHGREEIVEDTDVTRTVGWFTSLYPVVLRKEEGWSIGEAVKSVKEQMRRIPKKGIGYAVMRYLSEDEEIREELGREEGEIIFNYLGQVDQVLGEESGFKVGRESAGEAQSRRGKRRYKVEVSGMIAEGRLEMSWIYSERVHKEETIRAIAEGYVRELEAIIEHCGGVERKGHTPSDYELAGLSQEQVDELTSGEEEIEDIYPLSPVQEIMLSHMLYAPDSEIGFEQTFCTLHGALNFSAFERAWQRVIDEHSILRTAFIIDKLDEPLQLVRKRVPLSLKQYDWRGMSAEQQQGALEAYLQEDRRSGFDFSSAPLMRLTVIFVADDRQYIVWSIHHLIIDGWCTSLILNKVFALYEAYSEGRSIHLQRTRPFRDYIAWLKQQDMTLAEQYWRRRLAGFKAPTRLRIERKVERERPEQASYKQQQVELSEAATEELQTVARQNKVTMSTLVQGGWAMVMSRYSGEQEVMYGLTVSGRPGEMKGVERMVGMFINILPVRVKVEAGEGLSEWMKQIWEQQAEMQQYEYSPLVKVQEWSEVPSSLRMFDSIVIFENYYVENLDGQGSEVNREASLRIDNAQGSIKTDYALSLSAVPGRQLRLGLTYDEREYEEETIKRMLQHMQRVLESFITTGGHQPLSSIEMVSQQEQQLIQANQSLGDDDTGVETLQAAIEEQAEKRGEEVAIEEGEEEISYREMNERANQIGREMRRQGVGAEEVVGIMMERGIEMVVSMLGVLKAGGGYVLMEAGRSREELAAIINAVNPRVVMTHKRLLKRLPESPAITFCLDTRVKTLARRSKKNITGRVSSENVACVAYSLSLTGDANCVQISNRTFITLFRSVRRQAGLTPLEKVLSVNTRLDTAGLELCLSLAMGSRVVIVNYKQDSAGAELIDRLNGPDAAAVFASPEILRAIANADWQTNGEQRILCNGRLPISIAKQLLQKGASVWNLYGAREAGLWSALNEVCADSGSIPIGRSIAGAQIYVLDSELHHVPVGVSGKLFIGGANLANGYLNKPELTADKFVPDPFSREGGARLYKTGELACLLADGNIELLGRSDYVKLRGIRIAIGEIEAMLKQHPAIDDVKIRVRDDLANEESLTAYVITNSQHSVSATELQIFLKQKLPAYMVPSSFVFAEELLLTLTGEVDWQAISAYCDSITIPIENSDLPRDAVEFQLARIWEEVLGIYSIGITDNFFELGGHSITAVRLMARIRKEFEQDLPLGSLIHGATIKDQADILRHHNGFRLTSPLVSIQPNGSKTPVFCIHPAGGSSMCYVSLARHLGTQQPFYGLEAIPLDSLDISIEGLAKIYIEAIREAQPRGPYILGGWSFGGVMAFEMARQLREQGEDIPLLILLDTPAPVPHSQLISVDEALLLSNIARDRAEQLGVKWELSLETIKPDEQLNYVYEQIKIAGLLPQEVDFSQVRFHLKEYRSRLEAIYNYKPQMYSGRISLFRAVEEELAATSQFKTEGGSGSGERFRGNGDTASYDRTLGWSRYSTEPVEIDLVPGLHRNMVFDPHAQILAERLRASISKAVKA